MNMMEKLNYAKVKIMQKMDQIDEEPQLIGPRKRTHKEAILPISYCLI